MVENDEKLWKIIKKVNFPSCVREAHVINAHEETRRKKFVGQRLGVTPKIMIFAFAGRNTQQ